MKLQKLATLAGLALVLLAVTGCSLLTPSDGSISIQLPQEYLQEIPEFSSSSRALWSGTPAAYVRVYLEAQGSLVSLAGGGVVFEMPIPANGIINIERVPPIANCTLYISLSVNPAPAFRTLRYFRSQPFSVVAGATAEVNAAAYESPFDDIFLPDQKDSNGIKSALVETGLEAGRYFLANNSIYKNAETSPLEVIKPILAYTSINSLSAGNILVQGTTEGALGDPKLWINTDTGIYDIAGETIVTGYNITDSSIISLTDGEIGSEDFVIAFYQRKGSMGFGTRSSEGNWEWQDLIDDILSGEDNSDITDLINPDKNIISSYAIGENRQFGYYITPVGTLRLDAQFTNDLVNPSDGTELGVRDILNKLQENTIKVNGQKIQTLAYAAGRLVLGTDYGVMTSTVSTADGELISGLSTVSGIKANIVRMRSKQYDGAGPVWTAALGTGGSLYLLKGGSLSKIYRFYTGMPGFDGKAATTGKLLWTDAGLVITGTDSAVLLPKATIESF